jgi:hypothetical protein
LVGAALLVTPLAAAPAAPAATLSNVTAQSLTALIAQLPAFIAQILSGLGQTLAHPLGEQAPNSNPCAYGELVSATLTCNVVGPAQSTIDPGPAKAKLHATLRHGKVASLRHVK